MSVKITGVKGIKNKFRSKVNSMIRQRDSLVRIPSNPIIKEIRQNLEDDQYNRTDKKIDHVFTGKLLANTRMEEIVAVTSGLDHMAEFGLGYFVSYGLNLENGGDPELLSLGLLTEWSLTKSAPQPNPKSAQRSIASDGSRAWPLIGPIFKARANSYRDEVFRRVAKIWA